MTLVVGIKALNEEANIAAAIESALAACAQAGGGSVVLADSGSRDRTVAIAQAYPGVRILQLADPAERSCGTGAQLAFQSIDAEYFYLLDGDMALDPAFLAQGVAFLQAHPGHAAVGGRVREADTSSIEFELRARTDRVKGSAVTGDVDRLDCGGLYRVVAIRSAGYFADRNLHAFEEFELGARLRARGWKLARIDAPAVTHRGHAVGGYRLMLRRIRTGYAGGPGEVVRAAIGRPHWREVVRHFTQLRFSLAVIGWWIVLAASLATGHWLALAVLALAPLAFLIWRRGTVRLGIYSLFAWNVVAIGFLQGLVQPRRAPDAPIAATDLSGPAA
jgi:glycosyltransferase involved in cell wall biosynthesis